MNAAALTARLRRIRHVALDMDGTIYSGSRLFACTKPFLATLKKLGIGWTFLTNNSSKSVADYLKQLRGMDIVAKPGDFFTSTQATIHCLRESLPKVQRLFVLGTQSMRRELAAAGYRLTADRADDEPDAVVAGFDTALQFSRLCRAAWWIKRGKPYIASHPDYICPTSEPTLLVDCGSVCAALHAATGRWPDMIPGKPDARMLHGILHRHGLKPDELAMLGDRLYTDIVMARRAKALAVLVLTGEATKADAARSKTKPDLILSDVGEFGRLLSKAQKS
jgi:HAD superfamily hydrolase (TIGR01450 family)